MGSYGDPDERAAKRKANRDKQFANTLVHYLGVKPALEACRHNKWHSVRAIIASQSNSAEKTEPAGEVSG